MRFDHLMSELNRLHALCVKHLNNIERTMRHARRAAYQFTRTVMEVREQYPNEFLDYVMTHKLDIDAWQDEQFAPIEQVFGQDRRVLFANIKGGMTEKEYVKHGDLWSIRRERVHPVRVEADTEASQPAEPMPPLEEARYWKVKCEALISEVRHLRQQVRSVLAERDVIERRLANLTKVFKTGSTKAIAQ